MDIPEIGVQVLPKIPAGQFCEPTCMTDQDAVNSLSWQCVSVVQIPVVNDYTLKKLIGLFLCGNLRINMFTEPQSLPFQPSSAVCLPIKKHFLYIIFVQLYNPEPIVEFVVTK